MLWILSHWASSTPPKERVAPGGQGNEAHTPRPPRAASDLGEKPHFTSISTPWLGLTRHKSTCTWFQLLLWLTGHWCWAWRNLSLENPQLHPLQYFSTSFKTSRPCGSSFPSVHHCAVSWKRSKPFVEQAMSDSSPLFSSIKLPSGYTD